MGVRYIEWIHAENKDLYSAVFSAPMNASKSLPSGLLPEHWLEKANGVRNDK